MRMYAWAVALPVFLLIAIGIAGEMRVPAGAPTEVAIHIQRPDLPVDVLDIRVDPRCLLSIEGWRQPYENVALDGLCVVAGTGRLNLSIRSMVVVLFGLSRQPLEKGRRPAYSPSLYVDAPGYFVIKDNPVHGYVSTGRAIPYTDDIGQAYSFGTAWLKAYENGDVLPGLACNVSWRQSPNLLSFSPVISDCSQYVQFRGVSMFVRFRLSSAASRSQLIAALTLLDERLRATPEPNVSD